MNKKPVYFMQTDPAWKNKPYRTNGESSTIGSAGCGPSCAAMVISTLTGKKFTPEDACNWSMKYGYKALNQGTYYSYFKPQLKAFGIDCNQMNSLNSYGDPNHVSHKEALKLLKSGYYLIALMGKGTWTSSGHFVLVWWADDKIRINDPASKLDKRLNGNPKEFFSQTKYYWWVDARDYNNKEELDMTKEEFLKGLTDKEAYDILAKASKHASTMQEPQWSKQEGHWARAEKKGIVNGGAPERPILRDEIVTMLGRLDLF